VVLIVVWLDVGVSRLSSRCSVVVLLVLLGLRKFVIWLGVMLKVRLLMVMMVLNCLVRLDRCSVGLVYELVMLFVLFVVFGCCVLM